MSESLKDIAKKYKTVAEWADATDGWFLIPYGEADRTDVEVFLTEQFMEPVKEEKNGKNEN